MYQDGLLTSKLRHTDVDIITSTPLRRHLPTGVWFSSVLSAKETAFGVAY